MEIQLLSNDIQIAKRKYPKFINFQEAMLQIDKSKHNSHCAYFPVQFGVVNNLLYMRPLTKESNFWWNFFFNISLTSNESICVKTKYVIYRVFH